jgi:hypothetical protein
VLDSTTLQPLGANVRILIFAVETTVTAIISIYEAKPQLTANGFALILAFASKLHRLPQESE